MTTAPTFTSNDDNNKRDTRQPHPTITYPSVHLDSFSPEKFDTGSFPVPPQSHPYPHPRTQSQSPSRSQAGPSRLPLSRQIDQAGTESRGGGNGEEGFSHASGSGSGSGSVGLNATSYLSQQQQQQQQQQRPSSSASGQSTSTPRLQDSLTDPPNRQSNGSSAIMMRQASSSSWSLPRAPPTHPPPSLGLPPLPTLSPISPTYDLPADSNAKEASGTATLLSSPPAGPRVQGPRLGPALSIHIPGSPKPTRSVPPLKDSPSMARRRTVVEHEGFQGVALDVESSRNQSKDTPRRLEKKASTNDLRQQPPSPSSPTARRSLPRPPGDMTVPTTSTTWPVPNMPTRTYTPQHQPQKSASILPVVGGLADAGPYAATATPRQSAIGVGGPSGIGSLGVGRPPVSAKLPTRVPPQEEVCLECMMRDRDLADVRVIGPGAWSRQSDADWDELRWREEAILKSMGSQSSHSIPSLEDAGGSSDSEDTSVSLLSTGNSVEDSENRRKIAIKNRQRSLLRARRREADSRIAREVGWKGFIWEQGTQGEGMPKGFRGTVGGKLTEGGIKAVMTKYPKASEHRYEYLHKYLQHQWKLVMDIRADAQRRGSYPTPLEVAYNDGSVSSHEQIAARPRTSSISWDRQSAREPRDLLVTGAVRPSPSTPTELAALRPKPITVARPHTQLLPSEAVAAAAAADHQRMTPTPHSARSRYEKGISSPGTLERSPQPDRWAEDDDDALWSPISGGDGSLRPFSFAVRAGAAAARDGGHGHDGRKSLWGRWGGSVTSFFGGSQGGSGSMMDMHLGLDSDRRNANLPQGHNNYSRAVSMASPSRPSFFSRDSRASVDHARDPRSLSKSMSSSRLSQVVRNEDDEVGGGSGTPKKKKGLKGLIQKMKPKSKRQSTSPIPPNGHGHHPSDLQRHQQHQNEAETPLAPPPNMADLAGQGQQRHYRNGSSSSIGDSQGSSWKMRSVSAPIGGSSSGSLSASPTSSKYNRRESYNSAQQRGFGGENDGEMKRGSIVEVLHASQQQQYQHQQGPYPRTMYASPEPTHAQMYDHSAGSGLGGQQQQQQGSNSYPHPSFRGGSRHTAGSISNSSGIAPTIETPPMPLNQGPFFSRPPSLHSPATGNSNGFSPNPNNGNGGNVNRFKNLPPLPPPGTERTAPSPDSLQVFDQQQYQYQQQQYHQQQQQQQQPGYQHQPGTPDFTKSPPRGYNQNQYQPTPPSRASYDRPMSTARAESSPRMAHSMYVQPTSSTGSFARFINPNGSGSGNGNGNVGGGIGGSPYRPPSNGDMYGQPPHPNPQGQAGGGGSGNGNGNGNGFVESDKRSLMSKKGLRGFFGGAKNGRMA